MPHQSIDKIFENKHINDNLKFKLFKWYELGIIGCGKTCKPFIDMTPWINVESEQAQEVENEITDILSNMKFSHQPKTSAYVPEDVENKINPSYFVWRAEQYIPKDVLETFIYEHDVTTWIHNNNLAPKIWNEMGYIMKPDFQSARTSTGHLAFNKIQSGGLWVEDTPLLKQWIASWNIFEDLGRIVVFKNVPGNSINIHRDASFCPNKMHQVSIQFTKNRRGFVYDEVTKEKFYYNTPAYTFNSCDTHGVDATDDEVFTLRIDGIFKWEFCKKIGLVDGWLWSPEYASSIKIKDIQIFEPEERP
jgi:hypothetical protein